MKFNFNLEPGKELKIKEYEGKITPKISIIMPFYNDKDYVEQSVRCVLNQTFPLFELLIIDDGSKDKESLKVLEKVEKLDKRIKVFHKENEGLAATRDYGASKSSKSCDYLFFLDCDDLIEETYLECAYWTLQINKDASWAYSDLVGFGATEYIWDMYFVSKNLYKNNFLVATALVRKKDFFEINGYELREKAVNEDWNFWLKMIAAGKYPVKMSYYAFWYRRKDNVGELAKANKNKNRTREIVDETIKRIKADVTAIQYPKYDYNWDIIIDNYSEIETIKEKKNKKINLLFIIPWMVMGGADKFNIDFINGLDRNKFDITILTTEPAHNIYRQSYNDVTIYDLTSFLDLKYWPAFINYLIEKKNINFIMNSNSETGYSFLPYLKAKYPYIPIVDYIHMEEWYNRNGGYSRDSSGVGSVIDLTMTCNANSVKILENHFERDPKLLKTVYIGVDEEKFDPKNYDKNKLREELNIDKDKLVISYICRIANQKRPFLLMEIIKKYVKINSNCLFLIVGDGPLLAKMKSVAKKYELEDNIKFLGRYSETQKIYSVSDITINCSIKEGLALTSYESLSMNVPVISSDVGGQKELINDEVGVIVDCLQDEKDADVFKYTDEEIDLYVNALQKVEKNLSSYSKKCRKRILDGFTINHMIKNMNKILEDIYNNPNKERIENGKKLSNCIDITKELIVKEYVQIGPKYNYLCKLHNEKYGESMYTDFEKFKIKMWEHRSYRILVKGLKKVGIFSVVKKIKEKGEKNDN